MGRVPGRPGGCPPGKPPRAGDPLLNGLDVQLHPDDAGGTDGKVLGLQAGGGGSGLGHPLGILHALGGAGVGVAAVKNDPLGLVVSQVLPGEDHGIGLHHVAGEGPCGSAGDGGEDHGQILLLRLGGGEVILNAAVDARGLETFGGGDAARDDMHGKNLLVAGPGGRVSFGIFGAAAGSAGGASGVAQVSTCNVGSRPVPGGDPGFL